MNSPAARDELKLYRILVVDDEEAVLAGLRETLVREGHLVVTASNPFVALQELQQQPFSVIISDHCMPGVTGLEFLAQAKEIQPDATRILITAVLSLDTVIAAINKGEIYRFIVKPWLREELLATLKNAVQRYELIRRNTTLQAEALALNQQLREVNESLEQQMARVAEQNQNLVTLNRALAENLQQSVQMGLHILETFHPALGNQARRVHEICRAMAHTLNLPVEKRQALECGAWLHDIGLVGFRRDVIQGWQENPESLSPDQKTLLQSHPILGQNLVRFVHHLEEVGVIIRAHHERFDGTGFPDQLKGEDIPWLGRLLAVAVGFAESNFDDTNAIEAVRLASGTAYDPDAVRAFLRALPRATVPRKEREVLLSELAPGMVLAKGIYTANGLLLIPEGQPLSESAIGKLQNHNRVDPISQALLVFC
jgi:response regulator RpfG family c-di-GMP phosphodiesterase